MSHQGPPGGSGSSPSGSGSSSRGSVVFECREGLVLAGRDGTAECKHPSGPGLVSTYWRVAVKTTGSEPWTIS